MNIDEQKLYKYNNERDYVALIMKPNGVGMAFILKGR